MDRVFGPPASPHDGCYGRGDRGTVWDGLKGRAEAEGRRLVTALPNRPKSADGGGYSLRRHWTVARFAAICLTTIQTKYPSWYPGV